MGSHYFAVPSIKIAYQNFNTKKFCIELDEILLKIIYNMKSHLRTMENNRKFQQDLPKFPQDLLNLPKTYPELTDKVYPRITQDLPKKALF